MIREVGMERKNISSGTPWERIAGYSRAVRIGPFVCVSGTTASDADGNLVGEDDPYAQTVQILNTIEAALAEAGASIQDVIRTRIYVADFNHWREVSRAHAERFGTVRPANTLIQAGALVDGRLVEIEADAIVAE
jgi:enamine deaminase RidA (YjgF/YER057c/UK114 family)